MLAEIQVKKMTSYDIDEALYLGTRTNEFKVSPASSFYEREDLEELIEDPKSIFLAARLKRNLAGFLMSRQITRGWASMDNIVVDPAYREMGVANKLLDEFERNLKERGVKYVSGIVSADNKITRDFWKAHDYSEGKEFVWIERFL